jgi:hypothetical protein
MAGKHSAKKRHSDAHAWLGAGVMSLGLGVALTAGSGVAHADSTNASVAGSPVTPSPGGSAATTSIRTTVSAQSVVTSTHANTPATAGAEPGTSVVSTKETVVRQLNPADTGDNDPKGDSTVASQLLGLGNNDPGLVPGPGLPDIPFLELGGGGGGLLSRIAGALGF